MNFFKNLSHTQHTSHTETHTDDTRTHTQQEQLVAIYVILSFEMFTQCFFNY